MAFVSSYGSLGGSEIYLERLLGHLDRSYVHCVIALGAGPIVERLRRAGLPVTIVATSGNPRSFVFAAWKVRRLLLAARPDVVHANGLKAAIVTALATAGTRLPVVWVRHDFSMEGWRARLLGRKCRLVVCVSHSLARTFRGALSRKVHVIHTGVPALNVERDGARQHVRGVISEPEADPIISLVGHLIPGKGHLELIEIAPQLTERLPNVRILFVGGPPADRYAGHVERLKARVAELGLGEAAAFLGERQDPLTMIAGSDLVVMPSVSSYGPIETEGFPVLALEALAVGTPVVGYAVGGLPELVADCGSLVPSRDREGLRDAILRVATDTGVWERMSACGRERARASFSMAEMIGRMQHVYDLAARR